MNPELKAKWIADLRTNLHLQGREALRTKDDKFCCLGRLCEVARIPFDPKYKSYFSFDEAGNKKWIEGELPPFVLVKLKLDPTSEGELIKMNDCDKLTFPEIADWIERNL